MYGDVQRRAVVFDPILNGLSRSNVSQFKLYSTDLIPNAFGWCLNKTQISRIQHFYPGRCSRSNALMQQFAKGKAVDVLIVGAGSRAFIEVATFVRNGGLQPRSAEMMLSLASRAPWQNTALLWPRRLFGCIRGQACNDQSICQSRKSFTQRFTHT